MFLFFSFYKYFNKNFAFSFTEFKSHFFRISPALYFILLFFSLLNWSIESLKWKWILKPIVHLSFKKSFLSVMSGVAISQVFPNKTGEYIGRLAFVENEFKWIAALLSVWGSISQFLMTLLFGIAGVVFLNLYSSYQITVQISIALLCLSFILFLNLPFIINKLNWKCLVKLKKSSHYFSKTRMAILLIISMLRYLTFVIPYMLLVYYFSNTNTDFIAIFAAISVVFLLQTIVPSFLFSDIIARISIPVIVFSQLSIPVFTNNQEYLPGLTLYLFNLLIPSIIGFFVFTFKKINNQ